MTHDKGNLRALVASHDVIEKEMRSLRSQQQSVIHEMKHELITSGQVDFLNINWSALRRQYR